MAAKTRVNTGGTGADRTETTVDERTDGPGVSRIDPNDAAAPLYRLLAKMRSPLTLREMMISPVRAQLHLRQDRPCRSAPER